MIKIEKIPRFWMNELSGKMQQIVKKFLGKKQLNPYELKILKEYVIQWVDRTVINVKDLVSKKEFQDYLKGGVPPDYKKRIEEMDQEKIMDYVIGELLEYGFDPF